MSLIVETGTGVDGAESYVSAADCADYATRFGKTFTSDATGEAALRRATMWMDGFYRTRYPGQRRFLRAQALEWPRVGVVDANGYPIADDVVPVEIVNACCEAAIREQVEPNSLAPDLEKGGMVKMLKAGSVEIEYGSGSIPNTIFQQIDGILSSLIGVRSPYTASAARG